MEVYASFDESYPMWLNAVKNIAELDALMGLAKGSVQMGGKLNLLFHVFMHILIVHVTEPACRPTFIDQEKSVIEFEELRHPCVVPG